MHNPTEEEYKNANVVEYRRRSCFGGCIVVVCKYVGDKWYRTYIQFNGKDMAQFRLNKLGFYETLESAKERLR